MRACTSCGDCCGPVTATPTEARKIAALVARKGIEWKRHLSPLECGYHDTAKKRCRIYSARPAACRMYGVVKEMACPHFPASAHISLPAKQAIACGLMSPGDELIGAWD